MLAPLYRALNARGVTPADADRMHLWQAAAVLGSDMPGAGRVDGPDDSDSPAPRPGAVRMGELRPGMVPMETVRAPQPPGDGSRRRVRVE